MTKVLNNIKLETLLKCPHCGVEQRATMPVSGKKTAHDCRYCYKTIQAKEGSCCVFCSYGLHKCPESQTKETHSKQKPMNTIPQLIEKEAISNLMFPKNEVLNDEKAKSNRKTSLEQAMILGNNHHGKAKITFEDSERIKQIETTIWGVTDEQVIFKGGMVIPISRVHEVRI